MKESHKVAAVVATLVVVALATTSGSWLSLPSSSTTVESAFTDPAAPLGSFVLYGDSITEGSFDVGGWGARLADAYSRRADIVNRGTC